VRKQSFTTPIWADEISVERTPKTLFVTGKNHTEGPVTNVPVEANLLAQSVPLARWPNDRRKKPPHVQFANATTDAKLIEFVKNWGPVDGSPRVWMVEAVPIAQCLSPRHSDVFVMRQNLRKLRLEQKTFSSAARLIAEIQSGKPDPERIFKYHGQLPNVINSTWKVFFNAASSLDPRQSPAHGACLLAQISLCTLLDQFPPRLFPTATGPVEFLPMDPTGSIGKGIKHVLYGFLRLEYLRTKRRGLGVCPKCNEVFAKERRGAVYCSELCSKQHRSLEYYREHGRARRREKAAASKPRSSVGRTSSK
jgi:hypothetical protein